MVWQDQGEGGVLQEVCAASQSIYAEKPTADRVMHFTVAVISKNSQRILFALQILRIQSESCSLY